MQKNLATDQVVWCPLPLLTPNTGRVGNKYQQPPSSYHLAVAYTAQILFLQPVPKHVQKKVLFSSETKLTCSISIAIPLFLGDDIPTLCPLPTSIRNAEVVPWRPAVEYSRLLLVRVDNLPVLPAASVEVVLTRLGLSCGLASIEGLAVTADPPAEQDGC